MKKPEEQLSDYLVIFSAIAVILSVLDAFGLDVYLAATQWLLISIVLMLWAIYIHLKD